MYHSEAKAKSVRIVERGLADAVGSGIDILEEKGVFVANFGGGYNRAVRPLCQEAWVMNVS